jgi:hypothetical protein
MPVIFSTQMPSTGNPKTNSFHIITKEKNLNTNSAKIFKSETENRLKLPRLKININMLNKIILYI